MFDVDWTVLGITELLLALAVAAAVGALLAWKLPMLPLAPAIIAGGTAAALVLLFGRVYPAVVVVAGGGAAALAGLLYDRALIAQWGLVLIDAAIAALTAAFALPLVMLGRNLGLQVPPIVLLGVVAAAVALLSFGLRRADRQPGLSSSIPAFVAAGATFFAVWRGVVATQSIWWLGTMAALLIGASVISRARATPLGAAGTSYVALTVGILVFAVLSSARQAI